jgi:dienelactone hydrolase
MRMRTAAAASVIALIALFTPAGGDLVAGERRGTERTGEAEIETRTVRYTHNDTTLRGYLATPADRAGEAPGVLVVHEWWGVNDYAKGRAEQLARLGYVAFAADMYGGGRTTTESAEASAWAGALYRDPATLRSRAHEALRILRDTDGVDAGRIAAIGFCFGGTTVLHLAYAGAPLSGVVSFHGGLPVPTEEDPAAIEARILVLHGAADPHVPAEEQRAFIEAMEARETDWLMTRFGHAVHSFTNPAAGDDAASGAAYHADAAERSWRRMLLFLHELFGTETPNPAAIPATPPAAAGGQGRQR